MQNMFSQEADLHDWLCNPEALLTSILSLSFWNLTCCWWFRSRGMWHSVIGWVVPIIPEDRGAFILKGKQSIIRDQSPNDMMSHHRMVESSAAPLWEPQISTDMVLLEGVAEVSPFSLWFIWWSYPPCHDDMWVVQMHSCTFITCALHGCQWSLWHCCHSTQVPIEEIT